MLQDWVALMSKPIALFLKDWCADGSCWIWRWDQNKGRQDWVALMSKPIVLLLKNLLVC